MSINPSLRRKDHGNREEKEVSECVALLDPCPLFLKEQFINYILCVNLGRQICSLSVTLKPRGNWKALCDSQILSRPLDGLVCTKTLQISVSGCGMPPRMQGLDIGFLAMAIMPRVLCGMPQRMTIQAILLGSWQQRKKPTGYASLKEIVLRRQSLGSGRMSCGDPSGWVAFW